MIQNRIEEKSYLPGFPFSPFTSHPHSSVVILQILFLSFIIIITIVIIIINTSNSFGGGSPSRWSRTGDCAIAEGTNPVSAVKRMIWIQGVVTDEKTQPRWINLLKVCDQSDNRLHKFFFYKTKVCISMEPNKKEERGIKSSQLFAGLSCPRFLSIHTKPKGQDEKNWQSSVLELWTQKILLKTWSRPTCRPRNARRTTRKGSRKAKRKGPGRQPQEPKIQN